MYKQYLVLFIPNVSLSTQEKAKCFQHTFSFVPPCLVLHVCAANMAAIPVFNSFFFVPFLPLDPSVEATFTKKSSLYLFK